MVSDEGNAPAEGELDEDAASQSIGYAVPPEREVALRLGLKLLGLVGDHWRAYPFIIRVTWVRKVVPFQFRLRRNGLGLGDTSDNGPGKSKESRGYPDTSYWYSWFPWSRSRYFAMLR